MKDDTSKLKSLGSEKTQYEFCIRPDVLETFPNKFPEREYTVVFETDEMTSLCPKTGQPDFAHIKVEYMPGKDCIESKSLKLYLFSYRNEGSFMETITNRICEDLSKCCNPKWLRVVADFKARGGISTRVVGVWRGKAK